LSDDEHAEYEALINPESDSNRIRKLVGIAATRLKGSKAKPIHSRGAQLLNERQVGPIFPDEDLWTNSRSGGANSKSIRRSVPELRAHFNIVVCSFEMASVSCNAVYFMPVARYRFEIVR
jgi:hypothetical protein